MSRAGAGYIAESANDELKPILLVRALDILQVNNPSVQVTLYLTNAANGHIVFNENDEVQLYTAAPCLTSAGVHGHEIGTVTCGWTT